MDWDRQGFATGLGGDAHTAESLTARSLTRTLT
jgi:hypothetical protein